jgi:anti-sigma regulatory factor (Ser/Thr protein kinase)
MTHDSVTLAEPFVHPAVFYASDEEYLNALVPFIVDGLEHGQPVAVAVPGPKLQLLRDGLGAAAARVTMIDMTQAGRNPGWIIPGVLRRFADTHGDRHVRIIGEPIWPGRSVHEYPACAQHEALINNAFAGRDVTIACPYDTARLDAQALDDAELTHPLVWHADRRSPSDRYAPGHIVSRYNQPLPHPAGAPMLAVKALTELADVRRFALDQASPLGWSRGRLADLELIVTELVTNSLVHTVGPCELRIWRDHDHLICAVSDSGYLADPLAGRRPAARHQLFGRGLLLVNALADLVRMHTTPHGTTLRAMLRASC